MTAAPNLFSTPVALELYAEVSAGRSLQPVMGAVAAIPQQGPINAAIALRSLAALEVIAAITARRHPKLPNEVLSFLNRESPTIWPGARFQGRDATQAVRDRVVSDDPEELALIYAVADHLLARFSS